MLLRRAVPTGLSFLLLGAVLAGCSDDDTPSLCTSMQDLQSSLETLVSADTLTGGSSAIESAYDDVESSVDEVASAASDEFGDDVEALQSAIDDVGLVISDLGGGSASEELSSLESDINAVVAAFDTLVSDVSDSVSDCDLTTVPTASSS